MSVIANLFTPDHEAYKGVRPINIYQLRLLYFLMAAFVATDAWMTIIKPRGSVGPVQGGSVLRMGCLPNSGRPGVHSSAKNAADHAVHDPL